MTTHALVLPATGTKAFAWQALLLALAAIVLPAVAHSLQLPVNRALPMHWPVLLAALLYGWRSGLALGVAAPLTAFALSGMPPVMLLPAMCVELAVYGGVAGVLREKLRVNGFAAIAVAVVLGRVAYVVVKAITIGVPSVTAQFAGFSAAWIAVVLQIVVLPVVAGWVGKR